MQNFEDSAYTPASGVNFKVTKNLAVFANYSQSFQASAQSAKLGDQPLPNTRGTGGDYGLKANFLNHRLVFTLDGYYITQTGIKVNEVDPVTGVTEERRSAALQHSKGVEIDGSVSTLLTHSSSAPALDQDGSAAAERRHGHRSGLPSPLDGRHACTSIPL